MGKDCPEDVESLIRSLFPQSRGAWALFNMLSRKQVAQHQSRRTRLTLLFKEASTRGCSQPLLFNLSKQILECRTEVNMNWSQHKYSLLGKGSNFVTRKQKQYNKISLINLSPLRNQATHYLIPNPQPQCSQHLF